MVAGVVFGAVLGGATLAQAVIPDGNSIKGCRNTTSGVLRVINSSGQKCQAGETPLNWTTWKWRGQWVAFRPVLAR